MREKRDAIAVALCSFFFIVVFIFLVGLIVIGDNTYEDSLVEDNLRRQQQLEPQKGVKPNHPYADRIPFERCERECIDNDPSDCVEPVGFLVANRCRCILVPLLYAPECNTDQLK